jgi:Flp pilus assembly protein TadG
MMYSGRTKRSLRSFPRSTRGGAALELAVIFPVLLLLLIGVIDYGRVFFTSVIVANAARAGAEWGARDPANALNTAGIIAFAQADGQEAGVVATTRRYCECGTGVAHDCTSFCTGGAAPDVWVEVTARKTVSMFLPYPGLPRNVGIVRTSAFRNQ